MISHFLFDGAIKDYSNLIKKVKLNKNQILFSEGDRCDSVYLVLSGCINISTITLEGKEYVFNTLNKNDIFGDSLSFLEKNEYLGDGIAFEKSEIAIINKDDFINILREDRNVLNNYLSYNAKRNLETRFKIKLFSQQSIRDKILFYLKEKEKNKIVYIKSKEALAKELNVLRPSLSRELIELKKENIIDYDRKKIIFLK